MRRGAELGPLLLCVKKERLHSGGTPTLPEPWSWAPPGHARIFFSAPADVARLFRATDPDALDAMFDPCLDTWCHHQRGVHDLRVPRTTGRARTRFELPLGTYESGDVSLETRSQVRL